MSSGIPEESKELDSLLEQEKLIDEEIKQEIQKYKLAKAKANQGASYGIYMDDEPPQEASSPRFASSEEEDDSHEG